MDSIHGGGFLRLSPLRPKGELWSSCARAFYGAQGRERWIGERLNSAEFAQLEACRRTWPVPIGSTREECERRHALHPQPKSMF